MCTVTLQPAEGQHASREELLAVALAARRLLEAPFRRPGAEIPSGEEADPCEVKAWDHLREALLDARIGWEEYV